MFVNLHDRTGLQNRCGRRAHVSHSKLVQRSVTVDPTMKGKPCIKDKPESNYSSFYADSVNSAGEQDW